MAWANVPAFRFSFRGNMRTYPRSGFRSEGGTSECTLVPVFVPVEHPPKPPFWKPPFCEPANKGSIEPSRRFYRTLKRFYRTPKGSIEPFFGPQKVPPNPFLDPKKVLWNPCERDFRTTDRVLLNLWHVTLPF